MTEPQPLVVHLGPDPAGPGGMPAVVRSLVASRLSRRYGQHVIPTYRVVPAWRRHLLFAYAVGRLVLWCLRRGPRIVHVHTAVRGSLYRKAIVVAVAHALRRPVILHLHAGAGDIAVFAERLGPLRQVALRRTFAIADRVLSVSRAGAAEAERRFGATGVLVVPNAAPRVAAMDTAPPTADGTVVLYLGGFEDPAKGGAVLLKALPRLLQESRSLRVDLAGPGTPPTSVLALSARDSRVRWLGWLDETGKAAAYRDADIVVFPSLTEGLPVALLEALAYGRAIVATRAGGMPEVLADGVDALLVDVGDDAALAQACSALAADRARRVALGSAARTRAERLNEQAVYGPLDAIYAELLGMRAPTR